MDGGAELPALMTVAGAPAWGLSCSSGRWTPERAPDVAEGEGRAAAPPPIAMSTSTSAGAATRAAAPAARKAAPCPTTTPAFAMPMACPRRSCGTLTTKAALAAIWYPPNAADSEKITSETARPGCRAVSVSVPQVWSGQRSPRCGPLARPGKTG